MTQDVKILEAALEGYSHNMKNPNLEGERIISVGRAVGLAWELGQTNIAQTVWRTETAAVKGMPTLTQIRTAYEKDPAAFSGFETGEKKAFTAAGTPFSNAIGCYARALEYAAKAKEPAGEDSAAYWAGDWGKKVLEAARFPEQAAQLKNAIVTGVPLVVEKVKGF